MPKRRKPDPPELPGEDTFSEAQKTLTHDHLSALVPRSERPHTLAQIGGPGAPRLFVLDKPEAILGRGDGVALQVDSQQVSRQHVRFARDGDEYSFKDLGSRNGVYLNGIRVHAAVLREDDQVQVGDLVFVYHRGGG